MKRLQAFKFQLMPTGEQQRDMCRFSGSCRFVYNKALALQKENFEAGNKFINYVSMASNLPSWKRDPKLVWLKEAPSQALQHALKDLDKAFQNFFSKRTDFLVLNAKDAVIVFDIPTQSSLNFGVSDAGHQDIRVKKRIKDALELVDTRLPDHIVIGDKEVYSIIAESKWVCN